MGTYAPVTADDKSPVDVILYINDILTLSLLSFFSDFLLFTRRN